MAHIIQHPSSGDPCGAACAALRQSPTLAAQHTGSFLVRLVDRWFDWQERRRAVASLGQMDDRLLKDMGLSRADVDSLRRGSAHRV
ncbi:MAG: DUF1127 domain-containing protein [Rhodospirillaceae bacterium]|nr:DUF1127 domain-containing protein [Rhodospirillaceae bacterium]